MEKMTSVQYHTSDRNDLGYNKLTVETPQKYQLKLQFEKLNSLNEPPLAMKHSSLRPALKRIVKSQAPGKSVTFASPPKVGDLDNTDHRCPVQPADWNKASSAAAGSGIMDMKAAKQAVVFMDIPEPVVQLLIEVQELDLDPSMTFHNVEQLLVLADNLNNSPVWQAELREKIHLAKQKGSQGEQATHNNVAMKNDSGDEDDCQKIPAGMSEEFQSLDKELSSSSSSSSSATLSAMTEYGRNKSKASEAIKETSSETSPGMQSAEEKEHTSSDSNSSVFSSSTTLASSSTSTTFTTSTNPETFHNFTMEISINKIQRGSDKSVEMQQSSVTCRTPANSSEVGQISTQKSVAVKPEGESASNEMAAREQLQRRIQTLTLENQKLNHRKMCRACKKVELASSGITFLPCGHFVTCETCSEMFDACPACGKTIMATVRTFLS